MLKVNPAIYWFLCGSASTSDDVSCLTNAILGSGNSCSGAVDIALQLPLSRISCSVAN
jgi:hypothetical protein